MLADKLSEMMATFSDNRDSHYRAQLAALQADINLIMKADPYKNEPLEDSGQEASELISQIMGNNVPTAPSAGTDYVAQCGKHYSRFVDAVNDAMEERDYNLTMLYVRTRSSLVAPDANSSRRTSTKTPRTTSRMPTFTKSRSRKRSIKRWPKPCASV
jgi:hypothetical protein